MLNIVITYSRRPQLMVKGQSSPLGLTYDNCIIRLNTSSEVTDFTLIVLKIIFSKCFSLNCVRKQIIFINGTILILKQLISVFAWGCSSFPFHWCIHLVTNCLDDFKL